MLKMLFRLSLLLLAFDACSFVYAETLTFDNLTSPQDGEAIPVFSYGNFTFYYFSYAYNADLNPPTPNLIPGDSTQSIFSNYYPAQPPAYPYGLLDQNGNSFDPGDVASFYSTSLQPFTLNNMLVGAYDKPVTILGYRKGVLVDQSSTSAANDLDLLTLNWTNIDAVFFENSPDILGEYYVDLDTININEPVTPTNSTPEPSTIVLLGSGLFGLLAFARR
jgi:hypothetical protein